MPIKYQNWKLEYYELNGDYMRLRTVLQWCYYCTPLMISQQKKHFNMIFPDPA